MRADIAGVGAAQGEKRTLRVQRQFDAGTEAPRMLVGEEGFVAL